MKKYLILFLLLIPLTNALTINEIMYNPSTSQGPDKDLEWIELYNEQNISINLSNYKFNNKSLSSIIFPFEYIILARNKTAFINFYNYSNIIELDLSLSNKGDNLTLSNQNTSQTVSYQNLYANGNSHSLEFHNIWKESRVKNGTPGKQNSIVFLPEYKKLQISEFLPNPKGDDNAFYPNGEWIELHNPTNKDINVDGFVLYDSSDSNELYITNTNTESTIIKANSYLVVYDDRDSDFTLNNYNYEKIRLTTSYPYNLSDTIDEVSYSSSMEGMSWSNTPNGWKLTQPTPNETNNYETTCDWTLSIEDINVVKNNANFKLKVSRIIGDKSIITVKGEIKNVFGDVVKTYRPFTNKEIINKASRKYSPKLNAGIYIISFDLSELECETNLENNVVSQAVLIKSDKPSTIKINKTTIKNISQPTTPKCKNITKTIYINQTQKLNNFGEIIYESSLLRAKHLIPLFVIIALSFFLSVLIIFKL